MMCVHEFHCADFPFIQASEKIKVEVEKIHCVSKKTKILYLIYQLI